MEDLEVISELENVDPGVIEAFFKELPEKALNLGMRVVLSFVLLGIGICLVRLFRKVVRRAMERANADKGAVQFVDSCLKIALYAVLAMAIASRFGIDAASVVAVVGSLGLTFGFAVQGTLANFAGGVLILLLKPFVVGDYIIEDTNKNEGVVTEIQIFYTTLHTGDNKVIVLPNGTLANNSMTNLTRMEERRLDLKFGISYQADLKKAKAVLMEIGESDHSVKHDESFRVFVDELADSAVILGMRMWVPTGEYWDARWRIIEEVKLKFDEAGIEIPYPQIDVHL